jgi:hypothetical protein
LPQITTIIPTRNRPNLLRRAIDSVVAQTAPDFRLRVYDNASGSDTEAVVQAYRETDSRIFYHRYPTDIGAFENFQRGLQDLDTEFFSFLSDDDLLLPRFYESTSAALRQHPDAMFASTRVVDAGAGGTLTLGRQLPEGMHHSPRGLELILRHGHTNWSGTLFRSAAVKRLGYLDARTSPVFDLDLQLRVAARHQIVVVDEIGAVFFLDQTGKVLEWREPWLNMMGNLTEDEELPLPTRLYANSALVKKFVGLVYDEGMRAALACRSEASKTAADILLKPPFRSPTRAAAISLVALLTRVTPSSGRALSRLRQVNQRVRRKAATNSNAVLETVLREAPTFEPDLTAPNRWKTTC